MKLSDFNISARVGMNTLRINCTRAFFNTLVPRDLAGGDWEELEIGDFCERAYGKSQVLSCGVMNFSTNPKCVIRFTMYRLIWFVFLVATSATFKHEVRCGLSPHLNPRSHKGTQPLLPATFSRDIDNGQRPTSVHIRRLRFLKGISGAFIHKFVIMS
jgi:hypothetical protein